MRVYRTGENEYKIVIEGKPKALTKYNKDTLEFDFPFNKERVYILIVKDKKTIIFTAESSDEEKNIVYYKLDKEVLKLIRNADLVVMIHNHPYEHDSFSVLDTLSFALLSIYNKSVVNFLVIFPQSFNEKQTKCVFVVYGYCKTFYDFIPIRIENGKLYVNVLDILAVILNNLKHVLASIKNKSFTILPLK